MTLDVQLFGPLAEAASGRVLRLDLSGVATINAARVMARIAEVHPRLRPMLAGARLAVNCQYAGPEDPILESDQLALIAMVGGG
ncbi:MAG: MoaD/ThiS family protein [Phycisphaeraceae bacterium]|nr:MoaD/ThiS family protein [Phycisphaeraceae bacterium]